jgi:hypothetical protein
VPVTGSLVSTRTLHPAGGRAIAVGKPEAAITLTLTREIVGKTRKSQRSKFHKVAALCVKDILALLPTPCPQKELLSIRVPCTETFLPGVTGTEKMFPPIIDEVRLVN